RWSREDHHPGRPRSQPVPAGRADSSRRHAYRDPAMALSASLALIGALLAAPALAQEAPDALVKRVTEEVTQHKDVRSADSAKLRAVVETQLLPHIDTRRVTQMALGQNWRRATPEQQERLVREFTALLVRTYSGALA